MILLVGDNISHFVVVQKLRTSRDRNFERLQSEIYYLPQEESFWIQHYIIIMSIKHVSLERVRTAERSMSRTFWMTLFVKFWSFLSLRGSLVHVWSLVKSSMTSRNIWLDLNNKLCKTYWSCLPVVFQQLLWHGIILSINMSMTMTVIQTPTNI